MDTNDRIDSNLPVRIPVGVPPAAATAPSRYDSGGGVSISPKVLGRGLVRHGWRILALWLLVSVPAAYLLYTLVEPTYEAYSVIRIDGSQTELYGPLRGGMVEIRGMEPYLRTQVSMIKSDLVLKMAVSDPLARNSRMIMKSIDPKTDLAKKLDVTIIEDTYLIRVALESTDPREASVIVNAVVAAYKKNNDSYSRSAKGTLKSSLSSQLTKLDELIGTTKGVLEKLSQKGTVKITKPELNLNAGKDSEDSARPTFNQVSESAVMKMVDEITKTDLEILDIESNLTARKEAVQAANDGGGLAGGVDPNLEAQIIEEFKNDPEVVALVDQMGTIQDSLAHTKEVARRGSDHAAVAAGKKLKALEDERRQLWVDKYPKIRDRLLNPNVAAVARGRDLETIPEMEVRLAALKKKRANLAKMYEEQKVEEKSVSTDSFQFAYSNHELTSLLNRREQVVKNLSQVEFETSQEEYRVEVVNPADVPKVPANNKRLKYMALAPVGVLFAMLLLFMMLEIKAERVADLESLSSRVRSEVYALPPLPTARSLRKLSVLEADDQVEQFIQRLDHLRFAVCGESVELGKGRCVLITSAIGGEGKTTLAAQLAARCGNAGMSTLLIDADLRRTSLAALLDIPEGPGLSDVLKDEAEVDDVVVPVQGGTFHVLPAGLPIQDTSRVLQNRKFGLLITQFRQVYDLIIIDSPPVLPVPDSLILGRWADGAILAARYDVSRFPQVERARRQLDNAGIPVLGTVINGMRNTDTYYGRYTYSRRRSVVQPDASNTL